MNKKYKVGDKLRVKKDCEWKCGNYNGYYIVITENPKHRIVRSYSYDIYNDEDEKIDYCWNCFDDDDLEPYKNEELTIPIGIRINQRLGGTQSIKKGVDTIMSYLQSVPKRLKRVLDKNIEAMYQMGWINGDLDFTSKGDEQLMEMLRDEYTDKLGAEAVKRVKEIKKEEKGK